MTSQIATRPQTGPPPEPVPSRRERVERRAARRFLPEIQALRAVAVSLVVAFHLAPHGPVTRGGFAGVDVFFVISGYLITSHLLREVEQTGTIRLGAFYARRARRLLPASLLVALVVAVVTPVVLPVAVWRGTVSELVASVLYVENLWLAAKAVTYSASNDVTGPVQHYWSLSTEEQFYLVWPALVLLGLGLARLARSRRPVVVVGVVLATTAVASFAASVVWTTASPSQAYFVTPTRAWEFAAGALLPLLLRRWAPGPRLALAVGLAGVSAVVASSIVLSQQVPFPGWAALLPVLGTAACILAGEPRGAAARVIELGPVQWLGRVSYSVYLWHWPLVVLAPYVLHTENLPWWGMAGVVVLTGLLADITQRFVEDATRYLPSVRASSLRTGLASLVAMAVVAAAAGLLSVRTGQEERAQAAATAAVTDRAGAVSCVGGAAGLARDRCPTAFTAPPVTSSTSTDRYWGAAPGCTGITADHARCRWSGTPSRTIVVVGDSHAEQLRWPILDVARAKGWAVDVFLMGGCTPTTTPSPVFEGRPRDPGHCPRWTATVTDRLRSMHPDVVVTASYVRATGFADGADPVDGLRRTWRAWAAIAPVVVVRDTPGTAGRHLPTCLGRHQGDEHACTTPRTAALPEDAQTLALRNPGPKVTDLDLSQAFCDDNTCYPVVGGLPVYYDADHLTRPFAQSLRPGIEPVLTQLAR